MTYGRQVPSVFIIDNTCGVIGIVVLKCPDDPGILFSGQLHQQHIGCLVGIIGKVGNVLFFSPDTIGGQVIQVHHPSTQPVWIQIKHDALGLDTTVWLRNGNEITDMAMLGEQQQVVAQQENQQYPYLFSHHHLKIEYSTNSSI